MHICFAVQSNHGEAILDPEYCEKHPLGGTETSVVKIAQCLRKLGNEVTILTKRSQLNAIHPDIFIAVRIWNLFQEGFCPGKLNYLWCQDDIDQKHLVPMKDPKVATQVYQNCDGLIMISHYQANRWMIGLNAPVEKIFISSNGIDLPRFKFDSSVLAHREPHAYYASTPFRGLSELLDMWPVVRRIIGHRARLTICSSLQVYAASETPEYEALYERARETEGIEYLGSVGQQKLREVAAKSRALAYPCTFAETGCIAAMEAMASGCVVVATSLGALPETAWRNPLITLGNGWTENWIAELIRVLVDDLYYSTQAQENLQLASLMGWQGIAKKWLMRFHSDLIMRSAEHVSSTALH